MLSLTHPIDDECEQDESEEDDVEFLEAREDSAESLQTMKQPFDSSGPSEREGSGGGVQEIDRLVTVLAGLEAGKKQRGIAEDIWGEEDVAAVWYSDSWMRSQVRRWIPKAEALAAGGWRKYVPRIVPEE